MDLFKKYFSWYTTSYITEDYFIQRKAEYMMYLMHYLILAVSVIICLEAVFVEASTYTLLSGAAGFTLFGSILILLRHKQLNLAINIMIVSGFVRLFMIYFYPTPYQFYVMSLVNILIVAVVHTSKTQVRVKTIGILLMMIAKIPISNALVEMGSLHWRAVTQSAYATIFLLIFIQMTNFLVNIINDEISKTELLQKSAFTDHLTGLRNRRHFWEIHSKTDSLIGTYSIILFDVDHFKRVNDTMGHAIGDNVLIALADIVKKIINDSGYVFRWGGEEFLVLLPHSDKVFAKEISEELRCAVEKATMLDNIKVTISIGIEDNRDTCNIETVIARADQAMYKAKETGRNKICELTA